MSWQPRILPSTHDEGLVYLEDTRQSETIELLQVLDKLAQRYTFVTITYVLSHLDTTIDTYLL
jgi:hypothetical protein